jgi:hypothetical protein
MNNAYENVNLGDERLFFSSGIVKSVKLPNILLFSTDDLQSLLPKDDQELITFKVIIVADSQRITLSACFPARIFSVEFCLI